MLRWSIVSIVFLCLRLSVQAQEKVVCPPNTVVLNNIPVEFFGQTIEERYPLQVANGPLKITSGGKADVTNIGHMLTIQGELAESDYWREKYAHSPDTLYGRRPQNIFRLYIDTCLLSTDVGFYLEASIIAHDYVPPPHEPYRGGFDLIAQWWSPGNPNEAFLCRDYYGGFCGNVGYHGKLYGGGELVLSRERPEGDMNPERRYEVLGANRLSVLGTPTRFELQQPMRLRLELKEIKEGATKITTCADRNEDGVWEASVSSIDTTRAITGFFVPIIRSDWMSAEIFDVRIGTFSVYARSCIEDRNLPIRMRRRR